MSVLVDTNVLLRRVQPQHQDHELAVKSVEALLLGGEAVYYAAQNIAEFWCVATRPADQNGLGLTSAAASSLVATIEQALTLLPETQAAYPAWRQIVEQHGVLGTKVHDARLAALMQVHGVAKILTFNGTDFRRFPIQVIHPQEITQQTTTR